MVGSCRNCANSFCSFITDSLFYVYAPKYVTVYNRRLGVLFRLMQACAIAWQGIILNTDRPWWDSFPVRPYGHNVWAEDGHAASIDNENVNHCRNMSMYALDFGKDSRMPDKPTRCARPPRGERMQVTSTDLFINTMALDRYSNFSNGQGCLNDDACNVGQTSNATCRCEHAACRCEKFDAFLIRNVEADKVFFHHGYSVNFEHVSGRVSFGNDRIEVNSSSDRIITTVEMPDGKPCKMSGKTQWDHEDARDGLGGTVREWLACGGFDLDQGVHSLGADALHDKARVHDVLLRTAGADINVNFYYEGKLGKFEDLFSPDSFKNRRIDCTVKVEVVPKWKTWEVFSFLEPPRMGVDKTANRVRRNYGLSFQTATHGSIRKLSSSRIMSIIVNSIVIITFPAQIIYWLILYGVGLLSEIYYKAANDDLNVHDHVSGVGARLLNAMCSFKSLANKGQKWSDSKQQIPMVEVFESMCLVYEKHMSDGVLDNLEVAQLVACMMDGIDQDVQDGAVSLSEFVQTCTSNEILDLSLVAKLFDDHRKRGIMERLFDDTPQYIRARRMEIRRNSAPEVMKALQRNSSLNSLNSPRIMEETHSPRCSLRRTQELLSQPCALTQTIKTAVAEALGDLPTRIEQLEMDAKVFRNCVKGPEMQKDGARLKEEKRAPADGFERLMELENRVASLEVNRLQQGWLQSTEDLEARVSCLEVARLEEAWTQATGDVEARITRLEEGFRQRSEADNTSNSSFGVSGHPSKWSYPSQGLPHSVSASAEGGVQRGTKGSQSSLQRIDSQNVKLVVQEMQPRCSSRRVAKAISQNRDVPASSRGSLTLKPSLAAGTLPATMARSQRTRWLRRSKSERNSSRSSTNPLQHRGPSRDRTLGNQFPMVSANLDQHRVPLPTQLTLSGQQSLFSNV